MLFRNRSIVCNAVVFLGLVIACGCSGSGSQPAANSGSESSDANEAGGETKTIGYSSLMIKNPFFKTIADTLTREAAKHGYTVNVQDSDSDVNVQAKHVDSFIAQNVAAIVLSPADRIAIGPAIRRANEAGIPVFTCDLECVADDVEITGHVGTDNYQGGRLAGVAMAEALGEEGGKVLVVHYKQANSCVLRVQGFTDEVNEYNNNHDTGKLEIVAELEGGGSQDGGLSATADAVQAHPDIRGIFAINDPSAIGAWTALSQARKQDSIKVIGFDGQKMGKEAIRDGKIYADPIQFPAKMAELTIENLLKYNNGEEFEKNILIPTELYRQVDTANDPELQ